MWSYQVTKLSSPHKSFSKLTLKKKVERGDPYQHGVTKLPSYFVYLKFFLMGHLSRNWERWDPFKSEVTKLLSYQVHMKHFVLWLWKRTSFKGDPHQHGVTKLPSYFVYLNFFLDGESDKTHLVLWLKKNGKSSKGGPLPAWNYQITKLLCIS